jgi:hypothetical protein
MKFGVREIANVVFRAKADVTIGDTAFVKGQPVLYIDSAKTSTLEGAATTVYAQGGRGNTRLIAWEGEKTLTFTVEDALLSPLGFAILSGAGLIKDPEANAKEVHVHTTAYQVVSEEYIDLNDALGVTEEICATAPIFVMLTEEDGSITGKTVKVKVGAEDKKLDNGETLKKGRYLIPATGAKFTDAKSKTVMVDFYVLRKSHEVSELQIDAEHFAGYYYVEADTLFRRQDNGVDMPANITLPNVKIQSNFTFSMASTGDPSTFTFTMDAMPGYTYFDNTKKVLCVIQIVEDTEGAASEWDSVMKHNDAEDYFKDGDKVTDSGEDTSSYWGTNTGEDA